MEHALHCLVSGVVTPINAYLRAPVIGWVTKVQKHPLIQIGFAKMHLNTGLSYRELFRTIDATTKVLTPIKERLTDEREAVRIYKAIVSQQFTFSRPFDLYLDDSGGAVLLRLATAVFQERWMLGGLYAGVAKELWHGMECAMFTLGCKSGLPTLCRT